MQAQLAQFQLAVDTCSWDATWAVIILQLSNGKWRYCGHGSGEDVDEDAQLPNVQAVLDSSNWAKYNFQPLMFCVWTLDAALGRHKACLPGASLETKQAVSTIQSKLQKLYKMASGLEDGYFPPILAKRGQPASESKARDFLDAVAILSLNFNYIINIICLGTPFVGSVGYLTRTHPCYARLMQKLRDEAAAMGEPYMKRWKELPVPDPKRAKFEFVGGTDFEEMDEDGLERLKDDMVTYTQSLMDTYPERLEGFEGFKLIGGFPAFTSDAERQIGRDFGFAVDDADLLLQMVMHVGSQAQKCNEGSSGIVGAQEQINMHTTYAFLLRGYYLGILTDPLTVRELSWFTNARDGTAFGFGHMDHSQPIHFGYAILRPSLEQHFDIALQNALARSWSTRGLHHFTFERGRAGYNTVLRAFVGFAGRIAAVGGFRFIPADVQTQLARELQSLLDPAVDLTSGVIATGLTYHGTP